MPYGFGVRQPSKTRLFSDNKYAKQPQIKPINAQTQPDVPTVRPRADLNASKHQHAKPKAPFGLTVRERSAGRAPVAQPCLPETTRSSTYDKHCDSLDVAGQNDFVQVARSDMDELIERLKMTELRNKQLEDEGHKLEDTVERL